MVVIQQAKQNYFKERIIYCPTFPKSKKVPISL
jgi:hypothetical protein